MNGLQRVACEVAHKLGILPAYRRGDREAVEEVAAGLSFYHEFFSVIENE